MAQKLLKYYKYAADIGGISTQVQLAMMTKLPSTKAAMAPDSEENIEAFRTALEKILGKPVPIY